jgi:3-methylcrotonyl-CoA carboxylase alpha subunit
LKVKPIHKILIANRGEIALRIQRAARAMNIPTVAVFTDPESGSPWLREFKENYSLGTGRLTNTYLNISALVNLAKQCGADAIHPGYGFLSENHAFARECEENDVQFIGPSSAILRLMGDKLAAHDFVSGLGIPVIEKIVDTPLEITKRRHTIEYPVLVKAAAGGGGKGMRLVRSHHELTDVLEITASEALQYFDDNRVYIEKYLHAPRHIEVQVLGDAYGHIVHLFERECSIQRRHQKIIEEACAISLPADIRGNLIDAALTIAQAVQYVNAGTIEFLLDDSGDFFFLEMNPRIQVEHGITEMVTGIDLVREQIRIAEGHPLSFSQADITCRGHAIEARIYAEDPEQDLLPSPGIVHYFKAPDLQHIRMESSVTTGSEIYADFDPLIAKIIAHAASREEAIHLMEKAIEDTVITGVKHNLPLIVSILRDDVYRQNLVSTTFLQERSELYKKQIAARKKKIEVKEIMLACTLVAIFPVMSGGDTIWRSLGYWRNIPRISFRLNHIQYEMEYRLTGPGSADVWFEDERQCLFDIIVDGYQVNFTCNGQQSVFYHLPESNGIIVLTTGDLDFEVERTDRLSTEEYIAADEEAAIEQGIVRSPLPGKVNSIFVKANDQVSRGDRLVSIESMKLENAILAPYAGLIHEVMVSEGGQVQHHDPLIILKATS